MTVDLRGVRAVLLPGTGSDHDYVRRAFSAALRGGGAILVAPAPRTSGLTAGYWADLDNAARDGRIAVGGVSIGAAVAVAWALAHPDRTVAVLAALPAWNGAPGTAPAALAARHTAAMLRRDGIDATVEMMRTSSPPWLAEELSRSWRGQWPGLPDAMEDASRYVAPSLAGMAGLTVPLGVAGVVDDPVHPVDVAAAWADAAPCAALRTVTLAELGADPAVLGAACLGALDSASLGRSRS